MNYEVPDKKYLINSFLYSLLFIALLVSSCHRKTIPSASNNSIDNGNGKNVTLNKSKSNNKNNGKKNNRNTGDNEVTPLLTETEASGEPVVTAPVYTSPLVVVDARGDFAVTDSTLPADASKDILNPANARAYTPAQTKTLAYRFGKVPPRILYVPVSLAKKSAKGTYYVLDKKFWYWKKSNGYFYIDENYFR